MREQGKDGRDRLEDTEERVNEGNYRACREKMEGRWKEEKEGSD